MLHLMTTLKEVWYVYGM